MEKRICSSANIGRDIKHAFDPLPVFQSCQISLQRLICQTVQGQFFAIPNIDTYAPKF